MKKIAALILIVSLTLVFTTGCIKHDEVIEIKDRGVLRVGVRTDVPYFGMFNEETMQFEGLEIDLAHLFAKEILGDENAVELVAVTNQSKGPMLDNGEIDLIIAVYAITNERKLQYNFSKPYFTDDVGFLVTDDSELTGVADMEGKTVGVWQASIAEKAIREKAMELGVAVNIQTYSRYLEIRRDLLAGKVDAFVADKSILLYYIIDGTRVLDEGIKPQDYGIATKYENRTLAALVDDILVKIKEDGRHEEIVNRWTGK